MSYIGEAFRDEKGKPDIANFSLGLVLVMVLCVCGFMSLMTLVSFVRCSPAVKAGGDVVQCVFDPLPLAQSISLIVAAFLVTGLGGLTAYMLALRRSKSDHAET